MISLDSDICCRYDVVMGDTTPPTGENLRRFRLDAELTQRQLAQAIGLSERQYQRLEAGHSELTWDTMQSLGKALDRKPYEFWIEWTEVPA